MKRKAVAAIVCLSILGIMISGVILTMVANDSVDESVRDGVEARLMDLAKSWRITCQSYENNILSQEENARILAREIVTAQAKMAYELLDKPLTDNDGLLSPGQKEDILNRLSRHTVGKSGYIYILDYDGVYVLSKDRKRDGENIWDAAYEDGIKPIQDIIAIGTKLEKSEVGFYQYLWANVGDPEPRDKISAIIHFPELNWVVGVTAYYDDVVDTNYRRNTIEEVKNLIARQQVGRSGYIAILDVNGKYVVSSQRSRDGEDISASEDADGDLFIQDGVRKAIEAGADADFITYAWQNPGEASARDKIGGLAYYDAWGWVIWPSAYLDDFDYDSDMTKWAILTLAFSVIIFGIAVYELARLISRKPERKEQ